jgi:acyl-CoA thioester hydrolase
MIYKSEKEVVVRFNEVDSLAIVWHGHYVAYFEDGREDFGLKYGLDYLKIYAEGFLVPIVSLHCDYKRPLAYGDTMIIETIFVPTPAAKIVFEFNIYKKGEKRELVASGKTIQAFLDAETRTLQLYNPPFFEIWKNNLMFKND